MNKKHSKELVHLSVRQRPFVKRSGGGAQVHLVDTIAQLPPSGLLTSDLFWVHPSYRWLR